MIAVLLSYFLNKTYTHNSDKLNKKGCNTNVVNKKNYDMHVFKKTHNIENLYLLIRRKKERVECVYYSPA